MENIIPPLKLIWFVRKAVEKGRSVKSGIHEYLNSETDAWQDDISRWLVHAQQGLSTQKLIHTQRTVVRKQILMTLERGLKGESIHKNLMSLEDEILDQIDVQVQELLSRLPYLMLIPVALFFFPACLILMLGPFILQLTSSF
jgi:hypothetical protein